MSEPHITDIPQNVGCECETSNNNNNNNNNKYRLGSGIRIDLGNPLPVVRGDYLGRLS